MTCLEKLKQEHPEEVLDKDGLPVDCPSSHGYLENPEDDSCLYMECEKCWNREIPETTSPIVQAWVKHMEENPHIKDSGDRTLFDTGAVRDMREGKGRCDLMPLEVVYKYFELANAQDKVLWWISSFQKNGLSLDLYNAIECFCTICWACDPATMFLEVAKHFEEGAKKYGENNWQKGIPVHCYINSAVRHYLKWLRGDKDEPHDRAFVWNLMCCIWEVDYHKEDEGDHGQV